jgi:hypothetical protein
VTRPVVASRYSELRSDHRTQANLLFPIIE